MILDVVSTGSCGNAYVLSAGDETLLLDAGISIRKVLGKVKDVRSIVGCLVTHEHSDHAQAAEELTRRGIKTICSAGTKNALNENGRLTGLIVVSPRQRISLGQFTVWPFQTQHDAAEPFGYVVRFEPTGETLLYATDTYYLRYTFPNIDYWVVECNYVDDIVIEAVKSGKIDASLRGRLLESHMSLRRLKDALAANDLSKTRKIVLVHLSDERSDEARIVREIKEVSGIEEVVAATAGMRILLELSPF